MNILETVHAFIAHHLGSADFDRQATLQSLGMDREDIEELIFRLEDQYGLTASTRDEDRLTDHSTTAEDVCRFIEGLARQSDA